MEASVAVDNRAVADLDSRAAADLDNLGIVVDRVVVAYRLIHLFLVYIQ